MSWLQKLYETYNNNTDEVGVVQKRYNDREFTLLPISHTTQNAHIEINVTEDGNFHSAEILDKENTLIPTTEASSSRSGKAIYPYPLHDKLSYCAGDFEQFGGGNKEKEQFNAYIKQLKSWVNANSSHPKVKAIFDYVNKRSIIHDLVEENVLFLDNNKNLIVKWEKKYEEVVGDKPEIFAKVTGDVSAAFVRFNVHSPISTTENIWSDKSVYQSFIDFYNEKLEEKDLCFVTGEYLPSTERHANKVRHAADKAKLISSNDSVGFTFRGRFDKSYQAAAISYDVSQKAHNALKWLINQQGEIIDDRVFLVWGNDKVEIVNPGADLIALNPALKLEDEIRVDTLKHYANQVYRAIHGYHHDLKTKSEVNILVLDSATTGRMGVLYYRNLNKELYLQRLIDWHHSCTWVHRYKKGEDGDQLSFCGAPATKDIAFAAYGPQANKKVVKGLMERMLPCIVDGRKIPNDIVKSAISRASNPVSMDRWEWLKTLSITCALINRQEEIGVALDYEIRDRNYLFGRLLAVAYVIENWALREQGEKRSTNAERYMVSFSNKPVQTWKNIHASLTPYKTRLGGRVSKLNQLILDITDQFDFEDFSDEPLDGKYLLGFSSQVLALDNRNKKEEENV
ncbi:type I-C CRISPR-associated protein Cas8c/Csd1 [Amphibacillus cookii]|uniref:type I-C CRISPR-associated protein Cas8c/Csd1 n=1 Tax=Amphibacillus cookii TaxID=767787 RepID=UPI001959C535|nr:type I-C CRISPR-associated protein Cas8c/Csd1 [Amphibacillus cookii]MBM7541850.1 CRISPR-associated protein Csd1 [Amphibacillus cookii]